MLNQLRLVYGKEFTELLRDRRTVRRLLIALLFLPLVMQLALGFSQRNSNNERNQVLNYTLISTETFSELEQAFANDEKFNFVPVNNRQVVKTAIENETIDFALVISKTSADTFSADGQLAIDFSFHDASISNSIKERVESKINSVNEIERDRRLSLKGIDDQQGRLNVLQPLRIIDNNYASSREIIGNAIGGLLPYILFIMCLNGALFASLDVGAGEKEHGTLETLLLLPVPRHVLVLGKFLVVFTVAVVYSTLNICSLLLWLTFVGNDVGGAIGQVATSVNVLDLALILMMLVPVAAIFAAMLLSISCYAKSYKEASSMGSLLNVVMFLPIIVSILPGVELNWAWTLAPIINVSLAIKELVKGTMDYTLLVGIFASSATIALLMLYFCSKWFEKEAVLFRE